MPTIAFVDGVAIIIYPNDHIPPHIHAEFAEYKCKILIANGEVLEGSLPRNKLKRVQTWIGEHFDEVSYAWQEVHSGKGFKGKIE